MAELTLALGALLVLGIDLFGRRDHESVKSGSFAIIFQFALLVVHLFDYLLWHHTFHRESFSGMLVHGIQGDVMRSFFLVSSLLVSILAHRHNAFRKFRCAEFHHLTMLASAGLMILCQCQNFLLLFVVLETVALSFYPLVAYNRECPKSLEAGIKYLIFGALVPPCCSLEWFFFTGWEPIQEGGVPNGMVLLVKMHYLLLTLLNFLPKILNILCCGRSGPDHLRNCI